MKLLKMFGLAVIAALLAMAFAGAGSAMAENTQLCSNDSESSCTEITHVHETSVGKAKLLSKSFTIECNVEFLGDSLGLGAPLVIHGTFTYSSCNNSCVVTQEGSALLEVLRLGHETADVTYAYQVHVECGSLVDCKYNGKGLLGTGKGPLLSTETNGEVTLSEQTLNPVGGLFCPTTAKLDIKTTPLSATYIGAAAMVCENVGAGKGNYTATMESNGECLGAVGAGEGKYALGYKAANGMLCVLVGKGKGEGEYETAMVANAECLGAVAAGNGEWILGQL